MLVILWHREWILNQQGVFHPDFVDMMKRHGCEETASLLQGAADHVSQSASAATPTASAGTATAAGPTPTPSAPAAVSPTALAHQAEGGLPAMSLEGATADDSEPPGLQDLCAELDSLHLLAGPEEGNMPVLARVGPCGGATERVLPVLGKLANIRGLMDTGAFWSCISSDLMPDLMGDSWVEHTVLAMRETSIGLNADQRQLLLGFVALPVKLHESAPISIKSFAIMKAKSNDSDPLKVLLSSRHASELQQYEGLAEEQRATDFFAAFLPSTPHQVQHLPHLTPASVRCVGPPMVQWPRSGREIAPYPSRKRVLRCPGEIQTPVREKKVLRGGAEVYERAHRTDAEPVKPAALASQDDRVSSCLASSGPPLEVYYHTALNMPWSQCHWCRTRSIGGECVLYTLVWSYLYASGEPSRPRCCGALAAPPWSDVSSNGTVEGGIQCTMVIVEHTISLFDLC